MSVNVFLSMTTLMEGDSPARLDTPAAIGTPVYFSLDRNWTADQAKSQWYLTRQEALDICFSDDWAVHRSGFIVSDDRWIIVELDIGQTPSTPDETEIDGILATDVRKRLNDAQFDFITRKGYSP